jgi:hypothetical protein
MHILFNEGDERIRPPPAGRDELREVAEVVREFGRPRSGA